MQLYLKTIVCALCFFILTTYAAEVKVVARPGYGADRAPFIKKNLVQIFTLRTRYWPNGDPVQVFVLSRDSLYTRIFVKDYLGMSPQVYFDIISSEQASGRNSTPLELETSAELIFKVLSTPGAIGYADENLLYNNNGRLLIISQPAVGVRP